jgi:pentatricopeptide repeat protein
MPQFIDGLCKARAMDKAQLFLRQMVDSGVQPNKLAYSCLRWWREDGKVFEEMTSRVLQPNIVTSTR